MAEDSVCRATDLNQDEAAQLENLFSLLIDLNIIESPKLQTTLDESPVEQGCDGSVFVSKPLDELLSEPLDKPLDKPCFSASTAPSALTHSLQEFLSGSDAPIASFKSYLPEVLTGLKLAELQDFLGDMDDRLNELEQGAYNVTRLAPVLPSALHQQVRINPDEIAMAIAPSMGKAIKEQIAIEQDAIVDALYPVIGNTIGKYMAETVQAINQQMEEALSVKGISRKIRAKIQGISEAEMILRESMPFKVQAIFLIHKASGLIISEVQQLNHANTDQNLESEMVAGMLTAIRSFANDCMTRSGQISELDAIDYGTSKIILEVAGYCYLAAVVQGDPPKSFIRNVRLAMAGLVSNHSEAIEQFEGDSDTVPVTVGEVLASLGQGNDVETPEGELKSPLKILGLALLGCIIIPYGIFQYYGYKHRQAEEAVSIAWATTPELAIYRLGVTVERGHLQITGKLPNALIAQKAEQVAKTAAPHWVVNNKILTVDVPPDLVLAAAEVKRVTAIFNQEEETAIISRYANGHVSVQGTVSHSEKANAIAQAFERIPGVKSVSSAVQMQLPQIETRFYFQPSSAELDISDRGYKLRHVIDFVKQHPKNLLQIMGYHNSLDLESGGELLALARAETVQAALISQGVDPSHLQVAGTTALPPGVSADQPLWLGRCVALELIAPTAPMLTVETGSP